MKMANKSSENAVKIFSTILTVFFTFSRLTQLPSIMLARCVMRCVKFMAQRVNKKVKFEQIERNFNQSPTWISHKSQRSLEKKKQNSQPWIIRVRNKKIFSMDNWECEYDDTQLLTTATNWFVVIMGTSRRHHCVLSECAISSLWARSFTFPTWCSINLWQFWVADFILRACSFLDRRKRRKSYTFERLRKRTRRSWL